MVAVSLIYKTILIINIMDNIIYDIWFYKLYFIAKLLTAWTAKIFRIYLQADWFNHKKN